MNRAAISSVCLFLIASAAFGGVQWRTISNSKKGFYSAKTRYPVFTGPGAVSKLATSEYASIMRKQHAEFVSNAIKAAGGSKPTAPYDFSQSATVTLYNPNLASGYVERFDYSGGAHPNTFYEPINIGIVNGKAKKLRLENVLSSTATQSDVMQNIVLPALNAIKKKQGSDVVATIDGDLADSFVVTPAGLTWVFQPYAVGPYVDGAYFVKIPKSQLKGVIDPRGPLGSLLK